LERGANPNTLDITQLSPLAIACGTGGLKCISILIKYGAEVNSQSESGSTPLHECFFRDNIDCFNELMKYSNIPFAYFFLDPDTGIKNKYDMIPMEAVFIDDMDGILDHVIGLKYDDLNLSVGEHNIARLIMIGIEHSAVKCLNVLLK
jgi:ankyrin repeat protein